MTRNLTSSILPERVRNLTQTAIGRDDYDPTVPNLTIIDEASLIQAESEGFDPYDTIAGTSKANLLKDD